LHLVLAAGRRGARKVLAVRDVAARGLRPDIQQP